MFHAPSDTSARDRGAAQLAREEAADRDREEHRLQVEQMFERNRQVSELTKAFESLPAGQKKHVLNSLGVKPPALPSVGLTGPQIAHMDDILGRLKNLRRQLAATCAEQPRDMDASQNARLTLAALRDEMRKALREWAADYHDHPEFARLLLERPLVGPRDSLARPGVGDEFDKFNRDVDLYVSKMSEFKEIERRIEHVIAEAEGWWIRIRRKLIELF